MNEFEQYLRHHHVEPRDVSIASGVRYLTVWNAMRDLPIRGEQAQKIRIGVQKMTGIAYDGPLVITPERPVDERPTLPIIRIKRQNM